MKEEVSQLPPTWHFAFEKSPFPCFSPYTVEFQALVPGSIELHLLCHVILLYCQVDPMNLGEHIANIACSMKRGKSPHMTSCGPFDFTDDGLNLDLLKKPNFWE